MDLNFGNDSYVSNRVAPLKPWEIHEVELKSVEVNSYQGKKDPSKTYDVLKITFKNENGEFPITFFAPQEGDNVRATRKVGDHEQPAPSRLDNFIYGIGHIMAEVFPKLGKQLAGKSNVTFELLGESLIKAQVEAKGKKFYLKLIADNKGTARLPYFIGYSEKLQKFYINNNFIATTPGKLAFTAYELSRKDKVADAKPSTISPDTTTSGDIDYNLL